MTSPFWWGRSISRKSAWRLTLWTRSCYLPKRDRYFQHLCMDSLARLMLGKCDRWFYTDFGPAGWYGLIGVSCSLSLKLHGHLLSVGFFSGDTSFGPLRFGGYIPPNWCQLKVNSLTNELNAVPEFQRSRLRKTQKMCYLLAAPRTSLDGPARDILEKWPISRGQASGRCSFKKQKKDTCGHGFKNCWKIGSLSSCEMKSRRKFHWDCQLSCRAWECRPDTPWIPLGGIFNLRGTGFLSRLITPP